MFVRLEPNLQVVQALLQRDQPGRILMDVRYRSLTSRVCVVEAAKSGDGGPIPSALGKAATAASLALAGLG